MVPKGNELGGSAWIEEQEAGLWMGELGVNSGDRARMQAADKKLQREGSVGAGTGQGLGVPSAGERACPVDASEESCAFGSCALQERQSHSGSKSAFGKLRNGSQAASPVKDMQQQLF